MEKTQIIQAALNVLDQEGLEGVTLRRLATELDVKAASIYYHIPNKGSLLDEMANAILEKRFGTLDFSNDEREWTEWLDTLAHELRAAMLAHREGARVVAGAHPDIAVTLTKLWDLSIRVLHNGGFSYMTASIINATIINFTFGSVIEEQSSPPYTPGPENPDEEIQAMSRDFPTLAAAMGAWQDVDNDTHFDTSIRIIINGVRAELDSQSADTDSIVKRGGAY